MSAAAPSSARFLAAIRSSAGASAASPISSTPSELARQALTVGLTNPPEGFPAKSFRKLVVGGRRPNLGDQKTAQLLEQVGYGISIIPYLGTLGLLAGVAGTFLKLADEPPRVIKRTRQLARLSGFSSWQEVQALPRSQKRKLVHALGTWTLFNRGLGISESQLRAAVFGTGGLGNPPASPPPGTPPTTAPGHPFPPSAPTPGFIPAEVPQPRLGASFLPQGTPQGTGGIMASPWVTAGKAALGIGLGYLGGALEDWLGGGEGQSALTPLPGLGTPFPVGVDPAQYAALPGGAPVGGGNGGGTGQMGMTKVTAGGTGVRCSPMNTVNQISPCNPNKVYTWKRVIPTGYRIAGKRRSRSCGCRPR